MTNNKAIKIWHSVLEDVCGCYADSEGNRPCDYGSTCTRCGTAEVDKEYRHRLEENWVAKNGANSQRKYRVVVHDTATYCDIEAKSEEEAIQQALDWWIDRRPTFHVTVEYE